MKHSMRITTMVLAGAATIGTACGILRPQPAQAMPLYSKVFRAVYPDYMTETKCAVCHVGKDKTTLNDYGKAVQEALGARNVKDEETIKAALKEAAGKLPPKKP